MKSPKATFVHVLSAEGKWSCPIIGGDEVAGDAMKKMDEIEKDGAHSAARFARLVVRGKQIRKFFKGGSK